MSKTALVDGIKAFDLEKVRRNLAKDPGLMDLRLGKGLNLLQFCCWRQSFRSRAAADRQLALAKWLVSQGFDPRVTRTTEPGEDGEQEVSRLSLVWFSVAAAQNNRLARYFLSQGAAPEAMFAAAWWGNWEILKDLVRHGADINIHVGATPLHMAVDILERGVEDKPAVARRRLKTVKEFLRLGADPNIPAVTGATPLHSVLDRALSLEVLRLLLRSGANPDVPDNNGRTVREIARRKRDKRYAQALTPPAVS